MTARRALSALLPLLLLAAPARLEAQEAPPSAPPSTTPADAAASAAEAPFAAPFVGLDWRVMRLAGHTSHGPGFQVGALLFRGHLKVRVAGFARPGPINPATFEHTLPDGETYRGQGTLALRSDGSVVGLLLAPRFEIPGARWMAVELPLLVGWGAFGFYLHDEDRETPDGRRVSEWENELLDGADSGAGLALDVGLRVSFRTPLPWLRPYVGVHHLWVVGYDATLRGSYDGFSGVAGIELGGF
ncbi:MAG TPA: hypothetical protein RMH85_11385 [Polyangiaceae bacterium LLY-WYZ-15_(1-7)]|nr:hypothetical protein [Myxococcales bacterium]MAT29676.1 hypothetical protein [Sandaracinus sp.]HJL06751.1 hypothetical protein [Polyangiaceae bacterium LLY-WYZ-15_(1-7)]MBJ75089.1 hypothetical protein [Sandaracinus sp.]HJL09098.1 hypothetical protein [Polyangiaceae bacterium LLY-WYZ-15_(1-7)]